MLHPILEILKPGDFYRQWLKSTKLIQVITIGPQQNQQIFRFTLSYCSLLIGKDLAVQSEILETVGEQDPSEFYYGQGQDEDWLEQRIENNVNIGTCDPALSAVLDSILKDMNM